MAEFGLGAYLLEQGVLSREQLAHALETQVVYGGRLGTNLVELGLLDLDQIALHLSVFSGIPVAPSEWVEAPDPKALALVRPELLAEHGVLPLHVEGTKLHAALLDPDNQPLLGAITRAAGRSVVPYVLPELRLRFALERHAGIPRPVRFANAVRKLERVRRNVVVEPDDRPEEVRLREALGIRPLGQGEDLIDETEFAALHQKLVLAREQAAGGPAPASEACDGDEELLLDEVVEKTDSAELPADPVELEALLAAAADRDAAARIALALARVHAEAAALLVVHRGMVMGLAGSGGDLERRIEAVVVPIDAESVFAQAAAKNEPFRGAPPSGALDVRLLRALGRGSVREVALLPIPLRGRVVNLLYVDAGARPLAETALGALSTLTLCLARAYERIILRKRSA